MEITREHARKVVETVDAGLCAGIGVAKPGKMCVEAAVCYALGLPHGDNPACVSRALRRYKIGLNDATWSSNEARAKGLRRLAVIQLGSYGALDDAAFTRQLAEMTIRKIVPIALRTAGLENAAVRCETEGASESARDASAAAYAASAAYAADARAVAAARAAYASAACAASAADASASASAADAASAADDSAGAAAYAASATAYADYAANITYSGRDRVLSLAAEETVQILISMGAPGAQWLALVPLEEGK